MKLNFGNLTPRQVDMVQSSARTLWVGAGTKTGKSAAAHVSVATTIVEGKTTCWVGPWSEQTFVSYMAIKKILAPFIEQGLVRANDSTMRMFATNGGSFTPKTGDNPEAIYGGGYDLVIIDEATRQTEETYRAAQTTTSATEGKIKLMFNLDHGAANWAVRNLLRVKSMTREERDSRGEDCMVFPTGGEGLVSKEEIERIRNSGMPSSLFNALYNAEIPSGDLSLFRNLPEIFGGQPPPLGPELGHFYVMGIDLARKQNWTVGVVLDTETNRVVDVMREHQIAWTLQYAKMQSLYDRWGCGKVIVDCTGLGDPVEEELYKLGLNVEGFQFTEKSRNQLIEQLVIACDGKQFSVASGAQFDIIRTELEAFQVLLDEKTGRIKYGVTSGTHDDAAFALMLAWHAYLEGGHGPVEFMRVPTVEEVADKSWASF